MLAESSKESELLAWALKILNSEFSLDVLHHEEIVITPWSHVLKLSTQRADYYVKRVPSDLYVEVAMLDYLHQCCISNVPKLVASDARLYSFIMESCGDTSVRDLHDKEDYSECLQQGLVNYAAMQRGFESRVMNLQAFGLPDWRLDKLPKLYNELISSTALLLSDGVTEHEIARLQDKSLECQQHCEQLVSYGITETLCHGDFHDNNLVLDLSVKQVSVIDWGECMITHPFFSLASCLWALTHFHQLDEAHVVYQSAKQVYLSAWARDYSDSTLQAVFELVLRLSGVFAALAYQRMYAATAHLERGVQQSNPGSIAGCLRAYLNATS